MAFYTYDHAFRKTANIMICLVSGFPQEDDEGQVGIADKLKWNAESKNLAFYLYIQYLHIL